MPLYGSTYWIHFYLLTNVHCFSFFKSLFGVNWVLLFYVFVGC